MISCSRLTREFRGPAGAVRALDDVVLTCDRGELLVIHGASGSGKSTLLLTLGGLLRPDSGTVVVNGQDLYALNGRERALVRGRQIGFVFQLFHLVPYLSVLENVMEGGTDPGDASLRRRASDLLEELGLANRSAHRPSELSAGEKQRTALARALVKSPAVILADEPSGNLDPENAALVFRRLEAFRAAGGTVLTATHGHEADAFATRIFQMKRGRLTAAATDAVIA